MTEMGLGAAVDCRALAGYHIREADLFFEIIDPDNGSPLPDGETGEVFFSTLTRKGMPLVRIEPATCRVSSRSRARVERS
jgi:phenylacetate-coenzyme A ligase PaaK-like adenylate-forming protein